MTVTTTEPLPVPAGPLQLNVNEPSRVDCPVWIAAGVAVKLVTLAGCVAPETVSWIERGTLGPPGPEQVSV